MERLFMRSLTNNVAEIELSGKKLLLSERTARDVNALMDYAKKSKGDPLSDIMGSAIVIRDALKINLNPLNDRLRQLNPTEVKWFEFKKKREIKSLNNQIAELKEITGIERIIGLPIRQINELSTMVLELEGFDIELLKKKVIPNQMAEREGLAVTLQEG
jgi:hypothetical protein